MIIYSFDGLLGYLKLCAAVDFLPVRESWDDQRSDRPAGS